MTKYVISDQQLNASGLDMENANPKQNRWFDQFQDTSGLPHWTTSGWYAQLFDTEADANAIVTQLQAIGSDGFVCAVTTL